MKLFIIYVGGYYVDTYPVKIENDEMILSLP